MSIFLEKKVLKLLFLGFSSGLPILLVFSTLSVWLHKAGLDRSTVTLFSWAGFAYAFKYLWSPIVDNFNIPVFKKLGHRRSWLLFSQIMILFSLVATGITDPSKNVFLTVRERRRKVLFRSRFFRKIDDFFMDWTFSKSECNAL